jgi:hypothetical protein
MILQYQNAYPMTFYIKRGLITRYIGFLNSLNVETS